MTLIQYLCLLISEECNEVGQRASKLSRFGHDEVQPGQTLDNFERLRGEKVDLMVVYHLLLLATGRQDECVAIRGHEHVLKESKLLKASQLSVRQKQITPEVYAELQALTHHAGDPEYNLK
tara:strand:- start:4759 stop:5121 length:363 start_codon:yes stop_codon:yes gene_type:complete